jgi:phosphonate ABC transporter permease subunit PhnE
VKNKNALIVSVFKGLIIILVIIIYAFGFEVTNVNFKETRSENRLTQLTRIIRALAHPDLWIYKTEEIVVETDIYVPCPKEEINQVDIDKNKQYIILNTTCADPGELIVVKGINFLPGNTGPINFIPPSGATLTIGKFEVDQNGMFSEKVKLPKRQPVDEAQTIRVISRQKVGLPSFSPVLKATWDKIIETVFLALLATTFGTLLAIPISFLAARNLMSEINSPITNVALSIIGWPIGIYFALVGIKWITAIELLLTNNNFVIFVSLALMSILLLFISRKLFFKEDKLEQGIFEKFFRYIIIIFAFLIFILGTNLIAEILFIIGNYIMNKFGAFGFVGYFFAQVGEIINLVIPLLVALISGSVVGSLFSKFGVFLPTKFSNNMLQYINIILTATASAIISFLLLFGLNWLFQFPDPIKIYILGILIGAIIGIAISLVYRGESEFPIGSVIYIIMRGILNAIRSIEPLVYVIVFVVWVGIGPFAGALALALHTIAALAKLYSEQVENIMPGPLEAIRATGADRIQTIIYAVVPQIIPPYISFTIYRWDINVRMSTIIGFAGGGGIGFLLQQNIRLLDYRAASVQMLAIAVVVALMDYSSAYIRERFV